MHISELSVKKPSALIVFLTLFIGLGIYGYINMGADLLPAANIPDEHVIWKLLCPIRTITVKTTCHFSGLFARFLNSLTVTTLRQKKA